MGLSIFHYTQLALLIAIICQIQNPCKCKSLTYSPEDNKLESLYENQGYASDARMPPKVLKEVLEALAEYVSDYNEPTRVVTLMKPATNNNEQLSEFIYGPLISTRPNNNENNSNNNIGLVGRQLNQTPMLAQKSPKEEAKRETARWNHLRGMWGKRSVPTDG